VACCKLVDNTDLSQEPGASAISLPMETSNLVGVTVYLWAYFQDVFDLNCNRETVSTGFFADFSAPFCNLQILFDPSCGTAAFFQILSSKSFMIFPRCRCNIIWKANCSNRLHDLPLKIVKYLINNTDIQPKISIDEISLLWLFCGC